MRTIKCKRCESRMYEDEDGALYCPSCGWEVGTPVSDMVLYELDNVDDEQS